MALDARPVARLRYRYPPALLAQIGWALLWGRRRPFEPDAAQLLRTMRPPPRVEDLDRVPSTGSFVTVFNHYHSRSFPSWWCAIALSALIGSRRPPGDQGIRWVMTEAWTYPDPIRRHLVTPLSRWAFRRLAYVYHFVPMPPMPPRACQAEARAQAVRQVLSLARRTQAPLIAISPEGHDSPGASLLVPPAGVGRFLLQLAAAGLPFLPAGLFEEGAQFAVRFGPLLDLRPPAGLQRAARDHWATERIMVAIGRLLPPALWGAYRDRLSG